MLSQRLIVAIILIPLSVGAIAIGGWVFALLICAMVGTAAWEFWRMFTSGGFAPNAPLLIGGTVLLIAMRQLFGFAYSDLALCMLVLAAMGVHTLAYERGREEAAVDFAITLGGILYLGWLGGYFLSLRNLPNGEWWMLLALPAVAAADSGAYAVGRRIGRHKLSPRVSPKKSWEGYLAGIVTAALFTPLLALLWSFRAPEITPLMGLIVGVPLAIITPLGDLGESMIKRQFGMKDSSNLIPGHGGFMDRIDSWLWAAALGYYLVVLLSK